MAVVTDFLAAINQIAAERGIDPDEVYEALRSAILVAYKKEYLRDYEPAQEQEEVEEGEEKPADETLSVEIDRENGVFRIIARKEVVKKVEDDLVEIALDEAKLISKDLKVGDAVEVELPSDDFGRIAAQTAKQVILQNIRESEKEAVLSEFSGKIGEVFTAQMQRMQRGNAVFEIGKAVAIMPPEEQIPTEFYRIGERYKVLLKEIEDTPRGKDLVVSRASSEFLVELFRMEVPEIESGVVEVKAVAREAGSRSKMAVVSNQDGVDPIGSCVGQRGIRIANVMGELGEEKIDIIEWDEEIEEFVANALSPAKVETVEVNGETATVTVEEDQLSLAIGRDGQNVRLAWKITGKKIDILGPDGKSTRKPMGAAAATSAIDEALMKKLEAAGVSLEDAQEMSLEELMELEGIGKVTAEKLIEAFKTLEKAEVIEDESDEREESAPETEDEGEDEGGEGSESDEDEDEDKNEDEDGEDTEESDEQTEQPETEEE